TARRAGAAGAGVAVAGAGLDGSAHGRTAGGRRALAGGARAGRHRGLLGADARQHGDRRRRTHGRWPAAAAGPGIAAATGGVGVAGCRAGGAGRHLMGWSRPEYARLAALIGERTGLTFPPSRQRDMEDALRRALDERPADEARLDSLLARDTAA